MAHQHSTAQHAFKIRFLLTSDCTARCAYCHNEGQDKGRSFLAMQDVAHVLQTLAAAGQRVDEIILSGGEPTLHPQLAQIAQMAKASGALVSINTHGAHPGRLKPALPWLDEVKLHVDSFDPLRQKQSMGLSIAKVLQSIEAAQQYPALRTVVNHPLQSLPEALDVINTTRTLGVECKFIELLDVHTASPALCDIPWQSWGYQPCGPGLWQHAPSGHRAMARRCNTKPARTTELFVSADGVRMQLQGARLGAVSAFSMDMLQPTERPQTDAQAGSQTRGHPTAPVFSHPLRFVPRASVWAAAAQPVR